MSSLEIKVGPPCTWSLNKARIHHCSVLHPINKHSGFTPLVIVTLEPRVFKVHKSWGGLGFRPPQYFIHTKSFNQDQSSAQEHMGPTDAPLIPLGFFFFFFGCVHVCVSEGMHRGPLVPPVWVAVHSVTNPSRPPQPEACSKVAAAAGGRNALKISQEHLSTQACSKALIFKSNLILHLKLQGFRVKNKQCWKGKINLYIRNMEEQGIKCVVLVNKRLALLSDLRIDLYDAGCSLSSMYNEIYDKQRRSVNKNAPQVTQKKTQK